MIDLRQHPKLRQLARNLHIPDTGDCLRDLREHAIASVRQMLKDWHVETIEDLRMLIADKLSVKIELLHTDEDIEHLSEKYNHVIGHFRRILRAEFLRSDTEGLLIDNPKPGKGGRDYLVIVDARGFRKLRAYFTVWHELAHLLLYPRKQLVLEGFRRTPSASAKDKDPVESAVDHIAGLLAFWEPLFKPALHQAAGEELSLSAIEQARRQVAPEASLYAACLAAMRAWDAAAVFVTAEICPKSDGTAPSLRLQSVVANEAAREMGCELHKHMRVPPTSALWRGFHDVFGRPNVSLENQSAWEVSDRGALSPLQWHVEAVRRGRFVYGLLTKLRIPVPCVVHGPHTAARTVR
jgi:hypothetical protein